MKLTDVANWADFASKRSSSFAVLKPNVTEDELNEIVHYFCLYPGRAKARNIKIFINKSDDSDGETLI